MHRIALLGPTTFATDDRKYKVMNRSASDSMTCVEIQMPESYPRSPGGKRWFRKEDILPRLVPSLSRPVIHKYGYGSPAQPHD